MKTDKQRVTDSIAKHPDWTDQRRSDATGLSIATIRQYTSGQAATSTSIPKAKSLTDFRATYDKSYIVPRKINAALKTMGSSGWNYEVDFARLAGVTSTDLATFRDQYAGYIVALREGRRVWAGSARLAEEMRNML